MARDISSRALECLKTSPTIVTEVTVTPPGGDPVRLLTQQGWDVQETSVVAGTALGIGSIQFLPTDGVEDLFELVGWPGAVFDVRIGVNLGTTVEYFDNFQGRVVEGSSRRNKLGVTASLADHWPYYDGIPLAAPFVTTTATRAEQIANLFTMLDLSVSVIVEDDGGNVVKTATYTDRRGQPAADLAADGGLQVGFDGSGDLIIKAGPDLDNLVPVWTFRSGTSGPYPEGTLPTDYPTIVAGTLERVRPIADALANAVVVEPGGEWQTWKAQTARLTDTSDPRHADVIGYRPIRIQSNTIDNACDALLLAKAILARLLRQSAESARVVIAINPAVERDDVVYLAAMPTIDDPTGWNGSYIATSVTHSPVDGTTTIEAVSAAGYQIGQ